MSGRPQLPAPCWQPHRPRQPLPPRACDSHCHIYGPADRFPYRDDRTYEPAETPLETYQAMAKTLDLERAVFVQPVVYGHDHAAMLEALRRGGGRYAGVAILPNTASDEMIDNLHDHGVRGTRLNFVGQPPDRIDIEAMSALARRVHIRGWHIVAHVDAVALGRFGEALADIGVPLVIDHMGRLDTTLGIDQPAFRRLLDLVRREHVWVKISAADRMVSGPERYGDAIGYMRALAGAVPERTLWGTDWPHPNIRFMPDDGDMVDLLFDAIDDDALRHAILVDNPARLYDFRERPIP